MRRKISVATGIVIIIIAVTAAWLYTATEYVVPILMYHSIDNNYKSSKLSVGPKNFSRQMKFLHKHHYNVIPLEQAIPYLKGEKKPPSKTVAITFDDGFENNYQYAYPVLKKYNIPATIFIIVNRVGDPGFMSWEEIKEMSDSGLITIGSHSRVHFWLLGSDDRFLKEEIVDSKNILEQKLGKKVGLFCYPMGAFDEKSKKAVKDAGYACAVGTNPAGVSVKDIYAIKRIKISRSSDNLFMFWGTTTRLYTWFKRHGTNE